MKMDYSMMEAADCRRHGYILTDKTLGSGSYAKVKLARVMDRKMSRNSKLRDDLSGKGHNMVAIKIISRRDAPVEYLNKFMPREIDTMRITHKHANLIQLYEFFRSERGVYLVLEYAANGDILSYINDSVLSTGMAVEEEKARQLFRQIVAGVAFCHERNVVHRDLKCENILLDENWNVKISDFGFACRFPSNRCNMLSTFCGSYAYAAPEILAANKYDGKLADVWSLGIILYALVNGRLPFNDQDLNTLLDQTKKKIRFQSWVAKDCTNLIRRLLRQRPLLRMRVNEIVQHPWMRQEPVCNAWHDGAAAMYAQDPAFNKSASFTRFMTRTESIESRQRQDRRAIINEAQQQLPITSLSPSPKPPTTATLIPTEDFKRGRRSPTKTPILLANGRIVKRELSGMKDESRKDSNGIRYQYGPDHNKYCGKKLVLLKKKLAATECPSSPPNYALTMRTRMRNLYRRILDDNPEAERLFDMENESGQATGGINSKIDEDANCCLSSKKCEPAYRVRRANHGDSPGEKGRAHRRSNEAYGGGGGGGVLGQTAGPPTPGNRRDKVIKIPIGLRMPPQISNHDIDESEIECIAPAVTPMSQQTASPTDDCALSITVVAEANDTQAATGGRKAPPSSASRSPRVETRHKSPSVTKDGGRTPAIITTYDTENNIPLTPTSPQNRQKNTEKSKMLAKREKKPRSKLTKSAAAACGGAPADCGVRSPSKGLEKELKTSDLYSQLQNLPVLKKMAV